MAESDKRIVKWGQILTKKEYDSIPNKNPNKLYFISENGQIYKGDQNYTDAIIFVNNLPSKEELGSIIQGKIYIKLGDLSGYIWDGTKFIMIIRPVVTDITDDTNLDAIATIKAMQDYFAKSIQDKIDTGGITTKSVALDTPIVVNGQDWGTYKDGTTIRDVNLQTILEHISKHRIPPEYIKPTATFNQPANQIVESGTLIRPVILPTFNQNDAGEINQYRLIRDIGGVETLVVDDNKILHWVEPEQITIHDDDNWVKYTAIISYDVGPTKIDNLNETVPGENIKPGYIALVCTWTGLRAAFYGADTGTEAIISSDDIRALEGYTLPINNGDSITIPIKAGSTRITIAYPNTKNELESVIDKATGFDVVGIFELNKFLVAGINGHIPIVYKVYTYLSPSGFSKDATYIAKIKGDNE